MNHHKIKFINCLLFVLLLFTSNSSFAKVVVSEIGNSRELGLMLSQNCDKEVIIYNTKCSHCKAKIQYYLDNPNHSKVILSINNSTTDLTNYLNDHCSDKSASINFGYILKNFGTTHIMLMNGYGINYNGYVPYTAKIDCKKYKVQD